MIGVAGASALPAAERDWTPVESHIWELERSYLGHLQTEDLTGLAEFWHEEFIGWPSHAEDPVDRSIAEASISTLLETVQILSFDLHPLMIRVIGDLSVVQYRVDLDTEDTGGTKSSASYRITHTWLEERGRWRIVGGMSSRTQPE
jgi:ketosteroid isomerase-like protein